MSLTAEDVSNIAPCCEFRPGGDCDQQIQPRQLSEIMKLEMINNYSQSIVNIEKNRFCSVLFTLLTLN